MLLERQRWDRGGSLGVDHAGSGPSLSAGSEGRAGWFTALLGPDDGEDAHLMKTWHTSGVLELHPLTPAVLADIVRRVARRAGRDPTLSDAAITERLAHIDEAGRPLYAYFLGQALAGEDVTPPHWTREDLLSATLTRDRNTRWQRVLGDQAPRLGDGGAAETLAVLATILGGLECTAAAACDVPPATDAETRRRALVLTDGPTDEGATGPTQQVPPVQPDILGEWFVLCAGGPGRDLADNMDTAWRLGATETAGFLQRLAQDFPGRAAGPAAP